MKKLLMLILLLSLPSWAATSTSEEGRPPFLGGELEGNVALTTDYMLRGWTQSNHRPALQAGADYTHSSGFYLGVWGSNVSFVAERGAPPDTSMAELDLTGGYALSLAENAKLSLGFARYSYLNGSARNCWGIPLKLEWGILKAGVTYDGPSSGVFNGGFYPNLAIAVPVVWEVTVTAGAAYSFVAPDDPDHNYADFHLGLSRDVLGANVDLSYYFVSNRQYAVDDLRYGMDAARVVLTVSKAF